MTLAQQMSARVSYGTASRPRSMSFIGGQKTAMIVTHLLFEPNFDAPDGWPENMPRFPPGLAQLPLSVEVSTWQYPTCMLVDVAHNATGVLGTWRHAASVWVRE